MLYVLLAVTCSVLVSVLLKIARKRGVDTAQAITWNYLAASALCALLLKPQMASLQQPGVPWVALLALSVILPALFLVLAASVRAAGIVRTDIAQRLSLLLSLVAAFLFFGEQTVPLKLAGLALGLLAVVGILVRPAQLTASAPDNSRMWPALLTVWVGFALVDVLLKHISAAGTPFAASLQISFVVAFLGMLTWQAVRAMRGQTKLSAKNFVAGLLLGLINFGNIIFYVMAHRTMPGQPAVIFTSMNIGVVVLGTLVGVIGFGEKLSWLNRAAIGLAIVSIGLIALAPHG
jgi:drug/metabolite transporter (DMT)-like permease